jgi:hypothetical protein
MKVEVSEDGKNVTLTASIEEINALLSVLMTKIGL